jgi:SAM-dependent methyltransferase
MLREGYQVTADHEATHWWFLSRRELVLLQVRAAAAELGFPGRRLRLLDYGCGTGFNLPFLSEFGEVVGAEHAPEALAEFRKASRFPILDLSADLREHRSRFDVLLALDVLEHIDDDVEGLRTMRRFLGGEGRMVLTVPAYDWLWSGEDVISQHRRRYTRSALARVCEAAGLEVLYLSYFNLAILPVVATVVWARRLLARESARHSNLRSMRGWLNALLHGLTVREARWVGRERLRLPAGASLVCRLRAAGGAPP